MILNCFLADADGATSSVNLGCLFELVIGSPTVLPEQSPHSEKNTDNFEAYIISGPLNATYIRNKKWGILAYPNIVKTFNIVSETDQEEIYC